MEELHRMARTPNFRDWMYSLVGRKFPRDITSTGTGEMWLPPTLCSCFSSHVLLKEWTK